jgi:hypothetical protein
MSYAHASAKKFRKRTKVEVLNNQIHAQRNALQRMIVAHQNLVTVVSAVADEKNWAVKEEELVWIGEGKAPTELAKNVLDKVQTLFRLEPEPSENVVTAGEPVAEASNNQSGDNATDAVPANGEAEQAV